MKTILTISAALLVTTAMQAQLPGTAEKTVVRAAVAAASKNAAVTNAAAKSVVTGTTSAAPATTEVAKAAVPDTPGIAIKPTAPSSEVAEPPKHDGLRRDPFINPIVKTTTGPAIACSTGKHCLMIGQLSVKGIIVSDEGMLAIVENSSARTYFLRMNDPLGDGVVERITRDSVVFRQNVSDSLGRPMGAKEVVKRIVVPAA